MKRTYLGWIIAAAVLFAAPAGTRASGEEKLEQDMKTVVKHPEGHDDNPAAFIDIKRYDLGIYTLITFGVLFFLLAKFAWGPFTEGLRKREAGLFALRDEATKAKADAETLRAQLQKDSAAAQDQIRAMIEEARRDADKLRAEQREMGVKDAAAERERAKREIETAKDAALNDIYKQAVDLAALMSAKTLSRQISSEDHKKLLDESLEELKQSASKA
jgi:F-type H+-transporting ATPase subunit b